MDFLADFLANVFFLALLIIGFFMVTVHPSQESVEALRDHWKEIDRQGLELIKQLKGSGWELEDIANLPATQRRSFVEQLDLDYDIISEYIDVHSEDDEISVALHTKWMPDNEWVEYRATRQALRQVSKNALTMLPK